MLDWALEILTDSRIALRLELAVSLNRISESSFLIGPRMALYKKHLNYVQISYNFVVSSVQCPHIPITMSGQFGLNTTITTYNEEDKTWSGVRMEPLFRPQTSMGQIVLNALARTPQNIAQISHEDDYQLKNHEIMRGSVRVSLHLRDLGLKEGDVIGFAAGNSRNVASVVFGAMLNGLPVGTLDPTFEFADVCHIFGITQPMLVFCDPINYPHVKKALNELKNPSQIYVFDDGLEEENKEWKSVDELLKEHEEETRFV